MREIYPSPKAGDKFGRWEVVSDDLFRQGSDIMIKVSCACGSGEKLVSKGNLRSGRANSCGCLAKELAKARANPNAVSKHPMYAVWKTLVQRVTNPNDCNYPRYGGRGITMSEHWKTFEGFYADIGDPPFKGASIDRIDNEKGYSKENCRWATRTEQNRNTRRTVRYTYGGVTSTLAEFAEKYQINRSTLASRIYCYNMTIKQALEMPRQFTKTPLGVGLPADG